MGIHEFSEDVSYALVEITTENDESEETIEFDIDHVEQDDEAIYFFGDDDEPFIIKKDALEISKEEDEDGYVYRLTYPDRSICINILM